jgi:O-antigen/teichoic acid export membrane protein
MRRVRQAIRALAASRKVRAVTAISGATAAGQLLGVVLLPVLTRLYGPDAMGVYSILFSAAMVLIPLTSVRLDAIVPLVPDGASVRAVQSAALKVMGAVCLIMLIGIWVLRTPIASITDAAIYPSLFLLPAMVFLSGLYVVQTQALIRVNAYSDVARRNVTNSVSMLGTQVALGIPLPSPSSLTAGFIVGRIVTSTQMAATLHRHLATKVKAPFRPILRRYRSMLANLTASSVLLALGGNAPLLLMGLWFGPAVAGFMGVAQRILMVPSALIGTSISQVMLGEFANHRRAGKTVPPAMVTMLLKRLTPLALLMIVGPLVAGPLLAELVLGPEWVTAGQFAQLLGFVAAGSLLASPMAQLLTVLERTRAILAIETLRAGLTMSLGFLAYRITDSQLMTLSAMVASLVVVYAGFIVMALWAVHHQSPPESADKT